MSVFKAINSYFTMLSPHTERQYTRVFAEWVGYVGEKRAKKPTLQDIHGFISLQRKKRGITSRIDGSDALSWATISRKAFILKALYGHLGRLKITKENPWDGLELHKKRHATPKRPTEIVPFDVVQKLIEAPGVGSMEALRDKTILALSFACGLRVSEVVKLKVKDLRRSLKGTHYLHLRETKSGKDRLQALPDWALKPLYLLITARKKEAGDDNPFLFVIYFGQFATQNPLSDRTVRRLFKKYSAQINLSEAISPHSARATAITKLLSEGKTYKEVQEFAGHSSIQMVEVYDKRSFSIDDSPGKKLSYP